MITIRINYTNGTSWTTKVRAAAIGEVMRDLEHSPNVESWEVLPA